MSIVWTFAPSGGGRDAGINDPGVQTFKGNLYSYLARELIQNSLDAVSDHSKPVKVTFSLETVKRDDIPDIAGLSTVIQSRKRYWSSHPKAVDLLAEALEAIQASNIRCLRVSDFNTKGVAGTDVDRTKDWYNLVRCAGSSSKALGEGGSFGIGKNAPFAASLARTVLYSTRTGPRSVAFQGVTLLATHLNKRHKPAQPTGFLGDPGGPAIREMRKIPARFRRSEQGTDIWIVGYPKRDDWKSELLFSVLDSFWPAIDWGQLIVEVGDTIVQKDNLKTALDEFSGDKEFTGHIYYDAYKNAVVAVDRDIEQIGLSEIYLSSNESTSTKKIAMIRKTGMVINQRQFRYPVPFAGAFVCRNDQGNAKLRDMEPPRHDAWDPNYPEPGANKKIYELIGQEVRDAIKMINPVNDLSVLSIPGLERFLPDINADSATGLWSDEKSPSEGLAVHVASEAEIRPIRARSNSVVPKYDEVEDAQREDEDSEVGEVDEDGNGNPIVDPSQRSTDVGDKGSDKGRRRATSLVIEYRSYSSGSKSGQYSVIVRSMSSSNKAVLTAVAVGDDQKSVVPIRSARRNDGSVLPISEGSIGPVALKKNELLKFDVILDRGSRYALEIAADEVE